MLVDVVSVSREDRPSSNGKGTYGSLTVTYRSNGKIAEKKLMSFTNPSVFKHFESAKQGDVVEVTTNKNDKGFWDWTGIGVPSAAPSASGTPASSVTAKATSSTYETKEERAVKQRYIVRQSSLASAISSLSVGAKNSLSPNDVIEVAKQFEAYVFSFEEKPALDSITDDLESDIPY